MSSKASMGTLRAREKVLAHLEEEFRRRTLPAGTRLPSSRELSRALGVSVSTVQNVFQILVKQGVISTEIGNGSFLIKPPTTENAELTFGVTLGVQAGNPATDVWHFAISEAIIRRIAQIGGISIYPICLANLSAPEALEVLLGYRERVDGIILKPVPGLPALLRSSDLKDFPLVHLNPPYVSATSNFVSADYLSGFLNVGKALVSGGRKSVYGIDRKRPTVNGNINLMTSGLVGAIGNQIGKSIYYELVEVDGSLEEDGYNAAHKAFTEGRVRPDALVCAGDFLAVGARRYCLENGISIPDDVSIVAGLVTGALEEITREITLVRQPVAQIGVELVDLLCRLVRSGGRLEAGVFLPLEVKTGSTTTDAENQSLKSEN